MLVRGFARLIKDGNPVPDGTEVRIRLHEDNSLIATTTTVNGEYEYNFQGNPGPYYVTVEHAGETHVSSSKVVGMSGPVNIGGIPLLFRLWHDGFIPGVLDELAVSSPGVGMAVTVNGGCAIVRGVLYDQSDPLPLVIDAAEAQPRIDVVVLQVVPAGSDDNTEGRTRVLVKKGTASSAPTPPGLTQTSALWEIPLANVTVDPGASSIASNKVDDRRSQSNVKISDGYISTVMLADNAVTNAKMANNSVDSAELVAGSVDGAHFSANANAHIAARWPGLQTKRSDQSGETVYRGYMYDFADGLKADGLGSVADGPNSGASFLIGIAGQGVTAAKLAPGAVNTSKIDDGAVTTAKIGNNQVTTPKIATNAVTGVELAANSVTTGHIVNGTIVEADLSSAVQDKLNSHGAATASLGVGNWANFSSSSYSTVRSHSITLPAGTWLLFCIWDGRIGSQTDAYGNYQTKMVLSNFGDVTGSVLNWETTTQQGIGAACTRAVVVTGGSSRTLALQARRVSGAAGKVEGAINMYGIKVGP